MAIKSVKGHCSTKGNPVGYQFKEATEGANRVYYLGGSFIINAGSSGGEVKSTDLSGSFQYNQDGKYPGCRTCGNKYIYQCCHCNEFICYDGNEKRNAVCPACGKTSDVPATKDKRIVKSGVSAANVEIILAMDVSGSMSGSPIVEMKRAAVNEFVDKFKTNAKMALVLFGVRSTNVETRCAMTSDLERVKREINGLDADWGTPSPLPHIINNFRDFMRGGNGANRYVVIFTDGEWEGGDHMGNATTIKNAGIKIITIGTTGANMSFLRSIASPGAMIETSSGHMGSAFADAAKHVTQ